MLCKNICTGCRSRFHCGNQNNRYYAGKGHCQGDCHFRSGVGGNSRIERSVEHSVGTVKAKKRLQGEYRQYRIKATVFCYATGEAAAAKNGFLFIA